MINCCKTPNQFEFLSFRKKGVIYDKIHEKRETIRPLKLKKNSHIFFLYGQIFFKSQVFILFTILNNMKRKKSGVSRLFFSLYTIKLRKEPQKTGLFLFAFQQTNLYERKTMSKLFIHHLKITFHLKSHKVFV